MDRFLAVGKAAARTEGPEKVAGKATYAADKMFPRIVWGKAVRSGFPHARTVSIDTSKAKAYPGVLAVITGQDVPDILGRWRLAAIRTAPSKSSGDAGAAP